MARRRSNTNSSRQRGRKSSSNGTTKILIIIAAVCVVGLLGFGIYKLIPNGEYQFSRSQLDKYIELTASTNKLNSGAAVYVDMSDGMNFAYDSPQSKQILQAVINKFAADKAINFFELSEDKITPLDLSHTALFNYMTNPGNYQKQKAPIEQTLQQIIEKNQPALILSDFEEYKGGVIEKAAYAKKYLIDWLEKGFTVTFYKWNFTEKGKNKIMFMAVFDDNKQLLRNMVQNAVDMTAPGLDTFVLAGKGYEFPTSVEYINLKHGGNYHNAAGEDAVSAVIEDGSAEGYFRYVAPQASANSASGFLPLTIESGEFAEYYPLGVKWGDAVANAARMKEEGVPAEDLYTHFISKLFVAFDAQSGYRINAVEARVFDMQETMKAIAAEETPSANTFASVNNPEVTLFLKAGMRPLDAGYRGWYELSIDFDEKFNGSFTGSVDPTNLFRANLVIANASPNIEEANAFFSWDGNPSLAQSVVMTLSADSSNPTGKILFSYFLRSTAKE